jgi:hypothetical protein
MKEISPRFDCDFISLFKTTSGLILSFQPIRHFVKVIESYNSKSHCDSNSKKRGLNGFGSVSQSSVTDPTDCPDGHQSPVGALCPV